MLAEQMGLELLRLSAGFVGIVTGCREEEDGSDYKHEVVLMDTTTNQLPQGWKIIYQVNGTELTFYLRSVPKRDADFLWFG